MKTSFFTAAAFAAPVVLGTAFPQTPTNTTTLKSFMSPMAKRFLGEVDECEKMCEVYRPLNHCVSGGWQNNCYDACFHSCIVIGGETSSPSESDLIQLMSESSEWTEPDPKMHEYSDDERGDAPCQGYCKRSDGTVYTEASINATVDAMLDRVTAYGQIYHHLQSLNKPIGAEHMKFPVGTRLDAPLKTWVAGFKDKVALGDDLEDWYERLFKRVEQTEGPTGAHWAYRFERIVNKDNERDLGHLVRELPKKQRRTIVKSVHKVWDEQFSDLAEGRSVGNQYADLV